MKWAGGKSQLLEQFRPFLPKKCRLYLEPFVGAGAVFFHLAEQRVFDKAILIDRNETLISTYRFLKSDCHGLLGELKKLESLYTSLTPEEQKSFYYQMRDEFNQTRDLCLRKSGLFIFLNRTGFNGLYRENKSGKFNVPQGRYKNIRLYREERFFAASAALRDAELYCGDFSLVESYAQSADFIYYDPPYVPVAATANFTQYQAGGFSSEDQERLALLFRRCDQKGVKQLLSNSMQDELWPRLYAGFTRVEVTAKRQINRRSTGRGAIKESLIYNF